MEWRFALGCLFGIGIFWHLPVVQLYAQEKSIWAVWHVSGIYFKNRTYGAGRGCRGRLKAGDPAHHTHFYSRGCPVQAPLGRGFRSATYSASINAGGPASSPRLAVPRHWSIRTGKVFPVTVLLNFGQTAASP